MQIAAFYNYILSIPRKVISGLEESQYPFSLFLKTFFFILVIRSFIESFTQESVNYLNYNPLSLLYNLLHFYLAFISGAISLTLLFYAATRIEIAKIMKVILPFYAIVLIGPIIDITTSAGTGRDM